MNDPVRAEYSIDFRNDWSEPVALCVAPALAASHAPALAWKSGEVAPGRQFGFWWALDYSLFYSLTGPLRPGTVVVPRLIVPVPASGARLLFRNDGSTFSLRPAGQAEPGLYSIEQDASIPHGVAAIGVAIDGIAAAAVPAQPAIETRFTMHPVYWLALARTPIERGTVTDPNAFFALARIEFLGASRHVSTALTANGTLIVEP